MGKLTALTAIITGGSTGIGYAIAQKCAEEGATVIIVSRNRNDLESALSQLRRISHENHRLYALDVASWPAVQEFARWIRRQNIEPAGLVNCAGIFGPVGKTTQVDMQEFAAAVQTNFLGTVHMCHSIAPLLKSKTRKKIINCSGGGGTFAFPNYSAYAASKAAIVRFTENLAIELEEDSIDVNCIAPGFVVTRLHEKTLAAGPERAGAFFQDTQRRIAGGGVSPEKSAALAAFLLSRDADGIAGKCISAAWDPWQDGDFQNKLRIDKDFGALRRIDDQLFYKSERTDNASKIHRPKGKRGKVRHEGGYDQVIAWAASAFRKVLRLPPLRPLKRAIDREVDKTVRSLTRLTPSEFVEDDVFLVGHPKSGTTWLRDLLAGVIYGIDPEYAPYPVVGFVIPGTGKPYYRRHSTPMFFRSHDLPRPDYRRVAYLVRDGRDVMVSYFHYLRALRRKDIDLLSVVEGRDTLFPYKWHEYVEAWLANPYNARMIVIRYEDLQKDTVNELQRLCAFVGVEKETAFLAQIAEKASFQKARHKEILHGMGHPDWPRNAYFTRRGEIGSYRDEMPPDVLARFLDEAGATLRKLGYL